MAVRLIMSAPSHTHPTRHPWKQATTSKFLMAAPTSSPRPATANNTDRLANDVARLRRELSSLQSSRSRLIADVAAANAARTIARSAVGNAEGSPDGDDDAIFSRLLNDGKKSEARCVENLRRMSGLTVFKLRSPNPTMGKKRKRDGEGEELIGLRIEVFTQAKFTAPHYLILRPTSTSTSASLSLEVYKHTVPAFIPLAALAKRWLNHDLSIFARELRGQILAHALRESAIRSLEGAEGVNELRTDAASSLVQFRLTAGGSDEGGERVEMKIHGVFGEWDLVNCVVLENSRRRRDLEKVLVVRERADEIPALSLKERVVMCRTL
ncbi:hypothetical protein SAICODRAFT_28377 [Saitoella complicata NRRL Y-17804]|uniref:uncharacterized protein n=1 Tax=Saitoella complicata (strain BCRC 22490 / CBS 7301 / JCM 7358 / NBRC 10748 / NRRL Y-17804) TaxID=698492 RepID=UPI000867C8B5|nr:uncharacterized protein SAICODRAFT_28377 [Saitoella complicata NRRL Y-17804]ODQ56097.1 hypothetical protein SAICODRAFT_28377 [Saitoella complicata NRRL Y-17804]